MKNEQKNKLRCCHQLTILIDSNMLFIANKSLKLNHELIIIVLFLDGLNMTDVGDVEVKLPALLGHRNIHNIPRVNNFIHLLLNSRPFWVIEISGISLE